MKQIIEYGQKFIIKCARCGCTFSFEKEDVEECGPVYDKMVKVSCPQCNNKFYGWDIKDLCKQ